MRLLFLIVLLVLSNSVQAQVIKVDDSVLQERLQSIESRLDVLERMPHTDDDDEQSDETDSELARSSSRRLVK